MQVRGACAAECKAKVASAIVCKSHEKPRDPSIAIVGCKW